MKANKILHIGLVAASLLFIQPFAALAVEYHALLIGVGGNKTDPSPLKGPKNDVSALRNVLIEKYGFSAANITTLLEREATKGKILREIERLGTKSRPGDHLLLYFSGHGTSMHDAVSGMQLDLPHTSGALLPYDAVTKGSNAAVRKSLIIGRRDLVPIIQRIEKNRLVLAIFDACFSQFSVRTVPSPNPPVKRYTPMNFTGDNIAPILPTEGFKKTKKIEGYPYQNVFYISASSEREYAWDASGPTAYYRTIDGKNHGLFTDLLLRVLQREGEADNNHDGRMSLGELFQAVKEPAVAQSRAYFQEATPHALPENGILHSRVFFSSVSNSAPVKLENPPSMEATSSLQSSTSLVDQKYPNQSFNVTVDLSGKHGDTVMVGDTIGYSMYTEKDAYLLLLNINPAGAVYVIYPYEPHELTKVNAQGTVRLDNLGEVSLPVGKEVLKLIAFQEKPKGFDQLRAAEDIRPGSPLYKQLEEMLGVRGQGKNRISNSRKISQHTITVTSVEKEEP